MINIDFENQGSFCLNMFKMNHLTYMCVCACTRTKSSTNDARAHCCESIHHYNIILTVTYRCKQLLLLFFLPCLVSTGPSRRKAFFPDVWMVCATNNDNRCRVTPLYDIIILCECMCVSANFAILKVSFQHSGSLNYTSTYIYVYRYLSTQLY